MHFLSFLFLFPRLEGSCCHAVFAKLSSAVWKYGALVVNLPSENLNSRYVSSVEHTLLCKRIAFLSERTFMTLNGHITDTWADILWISVPVPSKILTAVATNNALTSFYNIDMVPWCFLLGFLTLTSSHTHTQCPWSAEVRAVLGGRQLSSQLTPLWRPSQAGSANRLHLPFSCSCLPGVTGCKASRATTGQETINEQESAFQIS